MFEIKYNVYLYDNDNSGTGPYVNISPTICTFSREPEGCLEIQVSNGELPSDHR